MCLGIPGQITEIEEAEDDFMRVGKVSFGGSIKEVSLAYVPEAKVDDYVVVHAGFALNVMDESQAGEVFGYLKEMSDLLEQEEKSKQSPPDQPLH